MVHKIWSSIIFDRLTWHKLFSDHSCSSKPFIRPDSSRFVSVRIMSVLCVSSSFVFTSSSKSWRQRPRYDWCPSCSIFSTVFRFTYTKDWPLINPGVKNFGRSILQGRVKKVKPTLVKSFGSYFLSIMVWFEKAWGSGSAWLVLRNHALNPGELRYVNAIILEL